ncbi:uncharacterized protein LOC127718872 [Mytilus californianus]|uniref:uncharacterized protein LOC127718872 n=1 Tax=Mytilus californianus TaxID=6549 RepID=UPI002247666C|nr:uncharacterized protein LOC127718872 [Mytilus californianus]
MATYENVNQIRDLSPNMFKCNASIKSDSFAVSNEIYGALLLEPTIPSVISDYEEVSDIDMSLPTVCANTKSIAKLHQPAAQLKRDREELVVPADVSVERNLSYNQLTKPICSTGHIVYEASEPTVLCVKPLSEEFEQTIDNSFNDLPSITSTPFIAEGFENLDDFWLDLAQGQAIRSNINREVNCTKNKSFISESNWRFSQTLPSNSVRKSENDLGDGFVRETCWTYSPSTAINSLSSSNEFHKKNDILIQLDYEQVQDNVPQQSSSRPESRMNIEESLYELARPETCLNKQTHMGGKTGLNYSHAMEHPFLIGEICLTSKYNTIQNGIYELSNPQKDLDEFRTTSLDRAQQNKTFLQTLHDNQLYESVDNLSKRSKLPVPSDPLEMTTKSKFSKTQNSKDYYRTEEPVYATVVKPITRRIEEIPTDAKVLKTDIKKLDESAVDTDITENDEFFSLASSRLNTTNTIIQKSVRPDSGLGLNYTYAKVSKPRRYENWPLTKSIKKRVENSDSLEDESGAHNIDFVFIDSNSDYATLESTFNDNCATEIQCGAVCKDFDPEDYDHYSTIEEIERQRYRQINDKTTSEKPPILTKSEKSKISLKTRMKGLITKVTKMQSSHQHQREKSVFYPFSFIYNFPIRINGEVSASVKTILPNVNGKCWIICKNDLKIRMYDSQGSETESIYIGLEGEDMAYDNKGSLYVSCKDTRRIFKIDTRNLCQISAFVDCDFFPLGLAFDILDNTLIVCQNQQTFDIPIGVASVDCIKKYSVSETLDVRNLTHEILFSHPLRVLKNSNTDIVVSDPETKSITMLNRNGIQKNRFSGNDIFKMECHHTFVCDLQGNILIYSQNISKPSNKNLDNVCLLDQSGDFIDTFNIEEVQDKTVNSLALTDLGFLWIGCDEGIFIFDYQII